MMAKQQFTLSLGANQVRQAVQEYAESLVDTLVYDLDVQMKGDDALIRVTKKRARKAKAPKVAAVKAAAA
jgi:nucleoid DNA-binding protein